MQKERKTSQGKLKKKREAYFFYVLRCKDGSLYSGIAKNISSRESVHNSGKGSKYVRAHGGGKVVYMEKFFSKGKALKREAAVKRLSRSEKIALIKKIA